MWLGTLHQDQAKRATRSLWTFVSGLLGGCLGGACRFNHRKFMLAEAP